MEGTRREQQARRTLNEVDMQSGGRGGLSPDNSLEQHLNNLSLRDLHLKKLKRGVNRINDGTHLQECLVLHTFLRQEEAVFSNRGVQVQAFVHGNPDRMAVNVMLNAVRRCGLVAELTALLLLESSRSAEAVPQPAEHRGPNLRRSYGS